MGPPRPGRILVGLAAALCGCGGGARYANAPRPATPVVVAAAITSGGISVSPDHLGPGLVALVVTNLTDTSQQLTLESAAGSSFAQRTSPINPDGTAELKADLGVGHYRVRVADPGVKSAGLAVGGRRSTSQNQLLLP